MPTAIRAKHGLTRRRLLVRSASTVALAGLGGVARPYLSRAADRPQFAGGIQSGDVAQNSAVIWARADRPARMQVECSTVESFKTILHAASADALPDRDFTSKLLLEGDIAITVSDRVEGRVIVIVRCGQHRGRIPIKGVVHANRQFRAPEHSLPD